MPGTLPLKWIATLLAISAASILGDTVIVESKLNGLQAGTSITPDPPFSALSGTWSFSPAKSTAPGCSPGVGAIYTGTPNGAFRVRPALGESGGMYFMDITFAGNLESASIVVGLSAIGATLSTNSTTAFQFAPDKTNTWVRVCTVKLDPGTNMPSITFTATAGTVLRFYADAVRFVNVNDLCLNTPQLSTVNGPLAAGQTSVSVPAVDGAATALTVYADGVQIGLKTSGIVAGLNSVSTSPLIKGQIITVTQTRGGFESCKTSNGPTVGGGANPRVRVALSIRENTALAGPIGTNGGTVSGELKFLGSSGVVAGGINNAPSGGKIITPSTCWQTVSFLRGPDPAHPVDPTYVWAGANQTPLQGDFGVLESIAFAIDDLTDTGPFQIYIDNLMNGSTLIQDFETANAGTRDVVLTSPGFSTTTSRFLLSPSPGSISPDVSEVSNANADTGTNSALVSWQFINTSVVNWLRVTTQGIGANGTPNPVVDLRQPISFRILLLPAGETIGKSSVNITVQPIGQNVTQDGSILLSVQAVGPSPLSYQWTHDGSPIPGATNQVYQIGHSQPSDAGFYSVTVSAPPPSCNATSQVALVGIAPGIISQPADVIGECGGSASFNVAASGSGDLSYQWQLNGVAIQGANTNSYGLNNLNCADSGLTFGVVITNSAGSITSSIAKLTVLDTRPPSLLCPTNITVSTDSAPGNCSAVINYSVTATDSCNGLIVTCDPPSGSAFAAGTSTVTCTATDCGSNVVNCSFSVTVTDSDPTPVALTIAYQNGGTVLVCWPMTCRNYSLEFKSSLIPTISWMPVSATKEIRFGRYCVQLPLTDEPRFYRLAGSQANSPISGK